MSEPCDTDSRPLTVWAVSSGKYSDYGIDRVFSTRHIAETYITAREERDEFWRGRVEEWPVDTEFDPGLACYTVMIHHRTGESWVECVDYEESWYQSHTRYVEDFWMPDRGKQPWWRVVVWARSEDEALKIAADRVAMAKAHNAGIT